MALIAYFAGMESHFDVLFATREWKPIRGCPGRYGLAKGPVCESPADLVPGVTPRQFRVASARDVVVVVPFTHGGLISYRRCDGTYVHTLNTAHGFARKLAQLGIAVE